MLASSLRTTALLVFSFFMLIQAHENDVFLDGDTPCCVDRMSTLSCVRIKNLNPKLFHHSCVNNADFAFVQCCRSCFDHRAPNNTRLDYGTISKVLLTDPKTAACYDKKGESWCSDLVRRRRFWQSKKYARLDCSSMPFAFRVCRRSCGYCSSLTKSAGAVYDYSIATNSYQCVNRGTALARRSFSSGTIVRPWTAKGRRTLLSWFKRSRYASGIY